MGAAMVRAFGAHSGRAVRAPSNSRTQKRAPYLRLLVFRVVCEAGKQLSHAVIAMLAVGASAGKDACAPSKKVAPNRKSL